MTFTDSKWQKLLGFVPSTEQQRAITAPLEPALVMAGAGTGKTAVMAARIAWLVATQQVEPHQVLGLTFTTKAAGELAERVRRLLPQAQALSGAAVQDGADPTISTYNAFGANLLKEHALRIGMEPDARVVVDALRYQLAFRVVANTSIDLATVDYDAATAVTDLMALDGAMGNYLIEPATVIAGETERLHRYEGVESNWQDYDRFLATTRKRIALAQLVIEFRQAKVDYDVIDYSDQIRLAAQAAQQSQAMRDMLQDQYRVVLLDEYQDTSVAQKVLLQHLFGGGFAVMAVGDPCQAIYRWRGAEISNMVTFPGDFPIVADGSSTPCQTYSLTINRRSAQGVLDAANQTSQVIRSLHPGIGALVSGRQDLPAAQVEAALFDSFSDEVAWTVERLTAHHAAGIDWRDMALLMRDRKSLGAFVAALEAGGVPVQVADAGALFALPEVREVIAYLQVIADPTANPSLARILAGPRWGIGHRDLAILGAHASDLAGDRRAVDEMPFDVQLEHVVAGNDRAERVSLLEALEVVDDPRWKYSDAARPRLQALAAELRDLRRHAGDPVLDLVARVIRVTGLGVEAQVAGTVEGNGRGDRLALLLDLVGSFRDLDGRMGLDAFLTYVADSDRFAVQVEAELPRLTDAVTVMTMHKAKGLEYSVVSLPGLTKGVFPSSKSDDYWPVNAEVLPPSYTSAADDPATRFPGEVSTLAADYDAHKRHMRDLSALDETRLAYVALTRAAHVVLACGSWWGPTQVRKRGPSEYLTHIRDFATSVPTWCDEPTATSNPHLIGAVPLAWPAVISPATRERVAVAAAHVQAAAPLEAGETEPAIAAFWDVDIKAMLTQIAESTAPERLVALPATLSASQVMALKHDEQAFLSSLIRPMPRQPSATAERGTAFHAWVETYYGDRGLFEPDDLPGAGDSEIYDDDQLQRLRESFERGRFAQRTPHSMEAPFALLVGGRTWRGRIDAVFTGKLDDPGAVGRWLVVDWKTGAPGSADRLQLDIYRHAWAQVKGIPPDDVEAAFYFVGHDVVEPLTEPLTLEQLGDLI